MTLTYAGVGSRKTPAHVLSQMTIIAAWLNGKDWHLHSGGAKGADTAFANGAPPANRTVFLPWNCYNSLDADLGTNLVDCQTLDYAHAKDIARTHHPAWHRCSDVARRLHARNAFIMLGADLQSPVDAVVCWTPGGFPSGGTGMAIRIAEASNIPVYNLGSMLPREVCESLLSLTSQAA